MTVMFVTFQNLTLSSPKKMAGPVSPNGEAAWSCCHTLKKNQKSETFKQTVCKKPEN